MSDPSTNTAGARDHDALMAVALDALRAASRVFGGLAVVAGPHRSSGAVRADQAWESVAPRWSELHAGLDDLRTEWERLPGEIADLLQKLAADAAAARSVAGEGPQLAGVLAERRFGESAAEWFYQRNAARSSNAQISR